MKSSRGQPNLAKRKKRKKTLFQPLFQFSSMDDRENKS